MAIKKSKHEIFYLPCYSWAIDPIIVNFKYLYCGKRVVQKTVDQV